MSQALRVATSSAPSSAGFAGRKACGDERLGLDDDPRGLELGGGFDTGAAMWAWSAHPVERASEDGACIRGAPRELALDAL